MADASIEDGVVTICTAYMGSGPVVERFVEGANARQDGLAAVASIEDGVVTICTAYGGCDPVVERIDDGAITSQDLAAIASIEG